MKILTTKSTLFVFVSIVTCCFSLIVTNPIIGQSNVNRNPALLQDGAEYLIITFSEPGFTEKLTQLANFRIAQGISTRLVTTTEIGSTVEDIKNYLNEAYTSWDIPPAAVMLVGDDDKIPCPSFQGSKNSKTDISDNYYADINGDDLPEFTIARLPINDLFNLTNYIDRIIAFESSPPDYPGYYDHPITSMSWTENSDIMFNAEVVNGFFSLGLNKDPLRENAIMMGTPGNSWFVSEDLLNYFGPNGLNYVPASPEYLTDWSGDAAGINTNLNNGSFFMLNIDHGTELGWSSPEYWTIDIQGINSADPFFMISINNLNGKFNWSSDCFAESLVNHQFGAAGVIASTTNLDDYVSSEYYFVLIDVLWDSFIPEINSGNLLYPFTLPAFANSMAKYHIAASGLPNTESTIYGFHYFGEPFVPIIYNYPELLNVMHADYFEAGIQNFEITTNEGSTICLSSNNEILSEGMGTGDPQSFSVAGLNNSDTLIITVTKQNFIRYNASIICESTTTVNVNQVDYSFQLIPNPAIDNVQIIGKNYGENPISVRLYDYFGKLIFKTQNISFPFEINRQEIPAGIYFVQMKFDEKTIMSNKLIFK